MGKNSRTTEDLVRICTEIADCLLKSDRLGAETDNPEGSKYIIWSDSCATVTGNELLLCLEDFIEEQRAKRTRFEIS